MPLQKSQFLVSLKHPITEVADQLAAQACSTEIKEKLDLVSRLTKNNIPHKHAQSMVAAATLGPFEKYGFGKNPELIEQINAAPHNQKLSQQLALELAIAETRDEILRYRQQNESHSKIGHTLQSAFKRITDFLDPDHAQNTEDLVKDFLEARLKQYEVTLNDFNFQQVLKHAYESALALQGKQARPDIVVALQRTIA